MRDVNSPNDATAAAARSPDGMINRLLNLVERAGNKLPDPVTIFILLATLALLASWVAGSLGVKVAHPITQKTIAAYNLLSNDGIRQVVSGIVPNFTGFAPLGTVLVAMIGIGVAERTGLFAALLKAIVVAVPRPFVTPTVVFAGCMSNIASDAGYVILTPLAAMLFASMGRHPLAGLAAVFAGVGGGFSANLLLGTVDPLLSGLSTEAARIVDPTYKVLPTANWYFMAASTILLTAVGTLVSDRLVEPRLGPWKTNRPAEVFEGLEPREKRALTWSGVATLVTVGLLALLVVPQDAPLRDADGTAKPFFENIVVPMLIFFLVPGVVFGLVNGKVRSYRDVAKMMSETMGVMGTYVVMAFFAGQFVAFFKASNLGEIIAIEGATLLKEIRLTGLPLMVAFVLVAATINLFMASASAKWAIMAPVFVPMMMFLGVSPEATQGLYRVGDSVTNVITPLNYYFPIIIAVAQKYVPKAGLGTLIASMLPYSVAFGLAWTAFIVIWTQLGLPLGPDAPLTYEAPTIASAPAVTP
jgi:aminobenzoyl-glutamate transport protein